MNCAMGRSFVSLSQLRLMPLLSSQSHFLFFTLQTQLDLFFNGKRTPTVQGPDTVTGGFYSNVGGWAIGGYNQFFAAAIRGTNPAATTPPQYTVRNFMRML